MSRTVRRKTTKHSIKHWDEYWYTSAWVYPEHINRSVQVPKKGNDRRKGWWRYHNDTLHIPTTFQMSWGQVRSKNYVDLLKWVRNSEHEPIFYEEINKREYY